jgi:signal transduction histidine kinase
LIERLHTANRLAADLETEKLASLKQLAYGASHEINNPLANIATRAQLLVANEKDETRRKHLVTIYQQAMRAHEMISDMMLFAHPPAPILATVDLVDWVQRISQEFKHWVAQAGWTIESSSAVDACIVQADVDQLASMVQAVIRNATESRPSGTVTIECRGIQGSNCTIEVRDDGPGISPETRRHMFDPFYSGREAGRGLGFGLSKAWTIAQQHGGTIRVAATSPAGTIFEITLPVAQS